MRLSVAAVAICLAIVGVSAAQSAGAAMNRKPTNIPAQPLAQALEALAKQRDLQVIYRSDLVATVRSAGAVGVFTPEEALSKLLAGTGLTYRYLNDTTVTIAPLSAGASSSTPPVNPPTSGSPSTPEDKNQKGGGTIWDRFLVAQVDQGQPSGPSRAEKQDERTKKPIQLEEVVVTGSRIPQPKEGAQEVKVYSLAQIEQSGQTTVADFINTLPDVSVALTENGYQQAFGGTTAQLHGLPIGTTLVLLNGRRLETSGIQGSGNFFDLNNIPLSAVDRIEVVSEGSSAIYGSDAIAGVVNILLKNNLNGAEGIVKFGGASGTHETDASVAWGRQWSEANFSIIGSFQNRSELQGFQRSLTASQDYTAYGGPNNTLPVCNPGNVFSVNGQPLPGAPAGSNATFAAVSAASTSGKPTFANFNYGVLNNCSLFAYTSFIPSTNREGVFAQGSYNLPSSVTLFTELLYSHVKEPRDGLPPFLFGVPGFSVYQVPASNPYNPFGEAVGVGDLLTALGTVVYPLDTVFVRSLVGARGKLFTSWDWEVAGWDSQDRSNLIATDTLNGAALQGALNSTNPATALNPFVAGAQGSTDLLQSLVYSQYSKYIGQSLDANGFARGTVVEAPAGPVELVLGGEYGRDKYYSDQINTNAYPPNTRFNFYRHKYALFGETRIPILGHRSNEQRGDTLAVTLAGRYDHYGDFGGKTTPQFGGEWRPFHTLLLRGTYAKAFDAPSLYSLFSPVFSFPATVTDPERGNATEVITGTTGGNPSLRPQVGQSRTLGLVYTSEAIRNLQISITRWSIDENDSVQTLDTQTIVSNENLFPGNVVRAASCSGAPPCPITQVNATFVNFGRLDVAGLDYRVSHKYETAFGEVNEAVSATQTSHYTAALTPGSPVVDSDSKAQDSGNWAPRWKGMAAVGWKLGPYGFTSAGRYVGRYQDYDSTREIGNFWLFDANFRYGIGRALAPNDTLLNGIYLEIGGVNLFNRLPQFSNYNFGNVGYDPTQSDLRGRFLYVELAGKL